jgi:hypothetical protein
MNQGVTCHSIPEHRDDIGVGQTRELMVVS